MNLSVPPTASLTGSVLITWTRNSSEPSDIVFALFAGSTPVAQEVTFATDLGQANLEGNTNVGISPNVSLG